MLPIYLRNVAIIIAIFQIVCLLLWYMHLNYNATSTVLLKRNISNRSVISDIRTAEVQHNESNPINNTLAAQLKPRISKPKYSQNGSVISDIRTAELQGNESNSINNTLAAQLKPRISKPKYSQNDSGLCPLIPPDLVGPIIVNMNAIDWMDTEKKYQKVIKGSYRPENCKARHKVAILVPYRDRDTHLRIFINHMHSFLIRQQLEYGIYIVELDWDIPFNRGFLFNVGFMEALKENNYGCFLFHDVDLLPMNDFNLYQCPDQPKHLSVAIDKYKFKLLYATNFGGVSSMTTEQFTTINGYSNLFFGWGGEDDDFYNRVVSNKMTISRDNSSIARYTMLPHRKASKNPFRMQVLNSGTKRPNQAVDGLNSLQYTITEKVYRKLYVHIRVTLDRKDAVKQLLNRLKKDKSQISESQIFETFTRILKN